jgi:hypothetical protein
MLLYDLGRFFNSLIRKTRNNLREPSLYVWWYSPRRALSDNA